MTTTITITRTVPAAPAEVFRAWTEVEVLAAWWWPHLAGTSYVVNARVGGGYAITSPVLGVTVRGIYGEVEPPRRLAFTWIWEDEAGASVGEEVVVTFDEIEAGTLLTVRHTSPAETRDDDTEQGWTDVLDRLARLYDPQSTSSRS
jgi:uncharacterized protein YndB with AHSA1/START domain